MILAIVGSREFNNYRQFKKIIAKYYVVGKENGQPIFKMSEVVSGGAIGTDFLAKKLTEDYPQLKYKEFPAEWNDLTKKPCNIKVNEWGHKYNTLAGYNRNTDIAKYCDECLAITYGTSGTEDTIGKVRELKKPILIISV